MSIESDKSHEVDLLSCPFIEQCKLPKHQGICHISGCKTCSEYINQVQQLKNHRWLH